MALEQMVVDGIVKWERNDATRKFTVYDTAGQPTFQRDYTVQENREADDRAVVNSAEDNRKALLLKVSNDIENMIAQQAEMFDIYKNKTDAQIMASPAGALRKLMEWQWNANNNLIALQRLVAGSLESTRTG